MQNSLFRPNRVGRFGLMAWRVRTPPAEQIHHRNEITQACPTDGATNYRPSSSSSSSSWRDKLAMYITLVAFNGFAVRFSHSAIFFISELLASYRNSSISFLPGRGRCHCAWSRRDNYEDARHLLCDLGNPIPTASGDVRKILFLFKVFICFCRDLTDLLRNVISL